MCGIAGLIAPDAGNQVRHMIGALSHRGPDGQKAWRGGGVALATQRLAIVDRRGGAQPLVRDENILVCNGEIYNHADLRKELESLGHGFQTQCDVEVILNGYLEWGTSIVPKLQGQFAFAIWDNRKKRLLIARDQFGIIPLVWTKMGCSFAFASEAKALLKVEGVHASINRKAVDDFLAMRYAPGPDTFFKGIYSLNPGHLMLIDRDGTTSSRAWAAPLSSGIDKDYAGSIEDATNALESALDSAVATRRNHGDVPTGLYLSGGLDSAVVGAFGNKHGEALPSFSHGYDAVTDEIPAARKVSAIIGGKLTEVPIQPELMEELHSIIHAVEQPVANSDILGLWALAKTASKEVKVVLCGEGADEIFGSYPHQQLLLRLQTANPGLKKAALKALELIPSAWLKRLGPYPGALSDPRSRQRLIEVLKEPEVHHQYRGLTDLFTEIERRNVYTVGMKKEVAETPGKRESIIEQLDRDILPEELLDNLINIKMSHWLHDYHLGRENRIAMAFGMEARYPFLDQKVVEAVLPLPLSFKVGGKPQEKRLLRQVAKRHLPNWIAKRPKGPVRVPLHLFSKEFDHLIEEKLTPKRLRKHGILRPDAVKTLKEKGKESPFLVRKQLFALVMLELWFDAFGG